MNKNKSEMIFVRNLFITSLDVNNIQDIDIRISLGH